MSSCPTEGWKVRKAFENAAKSHLCQAEMGTCPAPAAYCFQHKTTFTYVCLAHKLHFEETGHFFGLED